VTRPVDPARPGPVLIGDADDWTVDELAEWFATGTITDRPRRWYVFHPPKGDPAVSLFIDPVEEWENARKEANRDAEPTRAEWLGDRVAAVAGELRAEAEGLQVGSLMPVLLKLADRLDAIVDELYAGGC